MRLIDANDVKRRGDCYLPDVRKAIAYILSHTKTVKDAVVIVRCEDCKHANECQKRVQYTRNEPNTVTIGYSPIKWCSKGKRRSE